MSGTEADTPSPQERLAAFVAEHDHTRRKCRACNLPDDLQATIREGRQSGISFPLLVGFLAREGYTIGRTTLADHFRDHEQPKR
jgi:hypothetical protein